MNDFILSLFTSSDDARPALMFPSLRNGVVYATDTRALVAIEESELQLKYSENEKYPNTEKVLIDFQSKELTSLTVNVNLLAKELAKARFEVDTDSIKCKECEGGGIVEFEYTDKTGHTHYSGLDCPICEGEGCNEKESKFARISLSMIQGEDGRQFGIYINDLYFHPFQLYRLLMVAIIKKVDQFCLFYDPNFYGTALAYFDSTRVLIMGMIKPNNN